MPDEYNIMNWYSIMKLADALTGDDDEALWREIGEAGPRPLGGYGREDLSGEYSRRQQFTHRYGWAVPSRGALKKMKEWIGGGKVIEVGGGRGLWSRLLRGMGVTVEVSDAYGAKENFFLKDRFKEKDEGSDHTWTEVQQMSGEDHAATGGPNDVLMMIWPYMESEGAKGDWQGEALRRFGGRKFIYVGESEGGATGSPGLWAELNKGWRVVGEVEIPRWWGMHDWVVFYERN